MFENCGCDVDGCDVDFDIVPLKDKSLQSRDYYVKARKTHTCVECGEDINPGDVYERVPYIDRYFKKIGNWTTCKPCAEIAKAFYKGCARYIGNLKEDIWECEGINYLTGEEREEDRWWSRPV